MKLIKYLILLCLIPYITGCAAVAVSGVAATAGSAADRRTTGAQVEDQAIEVKAASALSNDEELSKQANISVTSYNSVVLLTGETPTDAMRQRAVDMIKNIDKVQHVYNELAIAAPSSIMSRSNDGYITTKVKTKLFANKEVTGLEIKVVTERGIVYLMGLVSPSEAEIATNIARETGGVQKVVKLFQYID